MSLSFLSHMIDIPGALCYVIYGSHPQDIAQANHFQNTVHEQLPNKIHLLDKNSSEARSLLDFYAITDNRYPISLLVQEDDTLAYQWTNNLPVTQDLVYHFRQIGD